MASEDERADVFLCIWICDLGMASIPVVTKMQIGRKTLELSQRDVTSRQVRFLK